jgi:hypothetical protein
VQVLIGISLQKELSSTAKEREQSSGMRLDQRKGCVFGRRGTTTGAAGIKGLWVLDIALASELALNALFVQIIRCTVQGSGALNVELATHVFQRRQTDPEKKRKDKLVN